MTVRFTFKHIVEWLVVLGLSFLVSKVLGLTEQSKAFFYIYLMYDAICATRVLIKMKRFFGTGDFWWSSLMAIAIAVSISILVSLGASALFGVDFYITYQILTLGMCIAIGDTGCN